MVAGAQKVCTWKPEYQAIRVSSARVILWVSRKHEFCRSELEKALGLNLGQAEWWVKELLRKGVIKKTRKKAPKKFGKGKPQVIYKHSK